MRKRSAVTVGLAAALALGGCAGAPEPQRQEPQAGGLTATVPVEAISENPVPLVTGAEQRRSIDRLSVRSPQNPRTPRLEEVSPAQSFHDPESGPPSRHDASYTDPSGDAHGGVGGAEALNQPAFDILKVDWTAIFADGAQRGYSTSITVAGTARGDASYASYGSFPSDVAGEECQLYHVLVPGRTAFAHGFCGSVDEGTRRFLGRIEGRPVTSRPTADGGTVLVATFDDPALPALLEAADRVLYGLSAFSCNSSEGSPRACEFDVWDVARSSQAFRV